MGGLDKDEMETILMMAARKFSLEDQQLFDSILPGIGAVEYIKRLEAQQREGERLQQDAQQKLMRLQELQRLRKAIELPSFRDFLKAFNPYPWCFERALDMPWEDYTAKFQELLSDELMAFEEAKDGHGALAEPNALQAIYCCIGEGGTSLHLQGMRVCKGFGGIDWGNPEDLLVPPTANDLLQHVVAGLPDFLDDQEKEPSWGPEEIKDVQTYRVEGMIYYFLAHAVYHEMKATCARPSFAKAIMMVGFGDGGDTEMILGRFKEGFFQENVLTRL